MLEVNPLPFVAAIAALRTLIERVAAQGKETLVLDADRKISQNVLTPLLETFSIVGCRSAYVATERLINKLNGEGIKFGQLFSETSEIESRFADHLSDVVMLVLQPNEASLMLPVDKLIGGIGPHVEGFPAAFPNASHDIEEAAKCYAFNRYTASVFHCMRALEAGVGAFSKLLDIPNPTKAAEKNWGVILRKITEALDSKWPRGGRISGTLGAEYEKIHVTLDAIKNPWRNATMHVESTYSPHESLHIIRCTTMFLVEIAKHCDEEGRRGDAAPALAEFDTTTREGAPLED